MRKRHGVDAARQGAIIVLLAVVLPMTLILAAFAINAAKMELNATEMYCAADAAARAGNRTLALTRSQATAQARAKEYALLNTVDGRPLPLASDAVEFGKSRRAGGGRYAFAAGELPINSVRVLASRSKDSPGGALSLYMPGLLGLNKFSLHRDAIATQVEIDLGIVVDRSGSMAYAAHEVAQYPPGPPSAPPGWDFGQPAPPASRWQNLLTAANMFLRELEAAAIDSLVTGVSYSDAAQVDTSLTRDHKAVFDGFAAHSRAFPMGGTNIGDGILRALEELSSSRSRSTAVKAIVVMTDGIHNIGADPVDAARRAKDQDVIVYTITFSEEADQARMQSVAKIAGGQHFHAETPEELIEAYIDLSRSLPTLLTH